MTEQPARTDSTRVLVPVLLLAAVLGGGSAYLQSRSPAPSFSGPEEAAPHQAPAQTAQHALRPNPPRQGADSERAQKLQSKGPPELEPQLHDPDPEEFDTESSMMARLRDLAQGDPGRTLSIARRGNELYPESADAAERNWYLTRALVNLNHFYEARDHAKLMVERFPDTRWANEVQRHLLVHPLGLATREEQERLK